MTYFIQADRLAKAARQFTNRRPVKKSINFQGLPVSIEIEVGDAKTGVDENGKRWSHTYTVPYGELPKTHALSDGDPVDVYIGPNSISNLVYVIHQAKIDGSFDEDKVMLGFRSEGEAVYAYKQHGPPWGFGSMDVMTFDQFKHGYLASNRKHQ